MPFYYYNSVNDTFLSINDLKKSTHAHQRNIRAVVIATKAKVVIVAIGRLLFFKCDIIRRIGHEF